MVNKLDVPQYQVGTTEDSDEAWKAGTLSKIYELKSNVSVSHKEWVKEQRKIDKDNLKEIQAHKRAQKRMGAPKSKEIISDSEEEEQADPTYLPQKGDINMDVVDDEEILVDDSEEEEESDAIETDTKSFVQGKGKEHAGKSD
jgi:hypothetical protein